MPSDICINTVSFIYLKKLTNVGQRMKKYLLLFVLSFGLIGACYAAPPITNLLICPQNISGTFNQSDPNSYVTQNGVQWYYKSAPFSISAPPITLKNINTSNTLVIPIPPDVCPFAACEATTPQGTTVAFVVPFCNGNLPNLKFIAVGNIAWEYNNS